MGWLHWLSASCWSFSSMLWMGGACFLAASSSSSTMTAEHLTLSVGAHAQKAGRRILEEEKCLWRMSVQFTACCWSQGRPSLQTWTWPAPPPSGPQRPPAQPGSRSGFPGARTCASGCLWPAWWSASLPGSSCAGLECAAALDGCGSGRWRCSGSPPCTSPLSPHIWTAAPPHLPGTSADCAPGPSGLPPPPRSPRGPERSAQSWRKCCWAACWSGTWWYTPLDAWSSGVGARACCLSPLGGRFSS